LAGGNEMDLITRLAIFLVMRVFGLLLMGAGALLEVEVIVNKRYVHPRGYIPFICGTIIFASSDLVLSSF
jgi:hypothetical protein